MSHFARLIEGIDTTPLVAALDAHPELWNRHRLRTQGTLSPHRDAEDIWLRFRHFSDLVKPGTYTGPHWPVWYPAWKKLPEFHDLVYRLMATARATHLGGVLITRVPPGNKIHRHHDRGSWHAEFHNFKIYVALKSNAGCVNEFEGETFTMEDGEAWWFDNQVEHECRNDGETDRISLIVATRVEP